MSALAVRQTACGPAKRDEKSAAELAELAKRLAWAAVAHREVVKADLP